MAEAEEALKRRDEILSAITHAAERFLWASAGTWPQTVQEVIAELGQTLKIKRIYLMKHQEVTAEQVITGLRYEWGASGVPVKMGQEELKKFQMQKAGFGRWAGVLYQGGVIHEWVTDLPHEEHNWFIGETAKQIIVIPVFVGQQWWGFIGFEDYLIDRKCSQGELDAFRTVAVTFGAAIRRKRIEEALNREKQKVEELDQLKSDFISMASHQLRTPLTSMRWYSERLLKKGTGLTTDQKEMAQVIHDTSAQLASLIDDLLNLSRIERGTMVAEPVLADIGELIEEVMEELMGAAEKKRMKVNTVKQGDLPAFWFDKKLIREVLLNLLSNAIKYTPVEGEVRVEIEREPESVLIRVVDTGMGIAVNEQEKIFERFFRSRKAIDTGIEGTGLGLSVAKLMVEKSGGTIWFKSIEGEGTTFFCRIPLKTEPVY